MATLGYEATLISLTQLTHVDNKTTPGQRVCTPVGLKRSDFDNKQVTFKEHVHREHSMWNYLYFFVLLQEKLHTELTGPESYVRELIKVTYKLLIRGKCYEIIAYFN